MKDEYDGAMNASGSVWNLPKLKLENEVELCDVKVVYQTFGNLNENRDNAIVVCHAFSGNAALTEWWGGLFEAINIPENFVICSNMLGSCYGTTGPSSVNAKTGKPYGSTFPDLTIRDSVNFQIKLAKEALGVKLVRAVIGGSLGGMQTLEWALMGKEFVKSIIPLACGAQQSAWQIGINHLQRNAICLDPSYRNGNYYDLDPPYQGLSLARQIAMVSYRTHLQYNIKFGRNLATPSLFDVESYLTYQGTKFNKRFDANSYITLMKMADSHDVGRGRGGIETALARIRQPTLIIGIDSDLLYPLSEQRELERHIPNAELKVVSSPHGHDGFLLEVKEIGAAIVKFLGNLA